MSPAPRQPRGNYRPQRRRDQRAKPPLQLQARDLDMIAAVWRNRFLTRDLLLALFPPDESRAPTETTSGLYRGSNLDRRLAKLFHHTYLDRLRLVVGGELIYALTQDGARLLKTRQPELPLSDTTDWREANRKAVKRGGENIEHALMVARFRTALEVGLPLTKTCELETFQREARSDGKYDLKRSWLRRGDRQSVVLTPDAFFTLRDTARPDRKQRLPYFLEADRSTVPLERMQLRYEIYASLYADHEHQHLFGVPTFSVLTVTKSAERASNLLNLVLDAPKTSPLAKHRDLFLFTSEQVYRTELANVLAAVWLSPHDPDTRESLTDSPLPRR